MGAMPRLVTPEINRQSFVNSLIISNSTRRRMARKGNDAVAAVLADRKKTHGDFRTHSVYAQALKRAMRLSPAWDDLTDQMKEALEMTQHKIARILNGDPAFRDHWLDASGYCRLVADELEEHGTTKP